MTELFLKHPPRIDGGPWPDPPTLDEVENWEAANVQLPHDYKSFLLKYNGGVTYPLEFDNNIDADAADILDLEATTGVDVLFSWDRFVAVNGFREKEWRKSMVAIGYDTTSSLIGISSQSESEAAILYWWRNLPDAWEVDEDGPMPIGRVASSFREFLFEKLYASDNGGSPRWVLPQDLETAHLVSF